MGVKSVRAAVAASIHPERPAARRPVAEVGAAPPAGHHHAVQFVADEGYLCDAVARFLAVGLAAGEPVVVITSAQRRAAFCERLGASSFDVAGPCETGQLRFLDAREVLATFMVGNTPDPERFRTSIRGVLESSRAGRPDARVRAYGDMVDLLCRDGKHASALLLEGLWNQLATEQSFSLLCGYVMMGRFDNEADGSLVQQICDAHTHVAPAEPYASIATPDARSREIARLQQRAHALETELARRGALESALREALRERARAEEELRHAHRVKDEFLATVSHELRSPLVSISGWTALLLGGRMDRTMQDQALASIDQSARQQANLIDDLLDVSRAVTGKLHLRSVEVDLAQVVKAAHEAQLPSAESKGVTFVARVPSSPMMILGDPTRLRQVASNLVANAIAFTPRGGHVILVLERRAATAHLQVSDNGQGISAAFLPYVFDRFRQADSGATRPHGGLGLGLSIVRDLVELHGGTVAVASEGAGRGARFDVTLPLGCAPPTAAAAADEKRRAAVSSPLHGLRVLVVEDRVDARNMLKVMVELQGARVKGAGSASEALEVLEQWRPDVLVSDIGLPGEDGYDLVRRARALPRERGGQIPAIALTASAGAASAARAEAAGYQMYLSKPAEPEKLFAAIAHLAKRSLPP